MNKKQMNTADRIKSLRKQSKLSRKKFGALVNCAESTVWRWEHGEREPSKAIMELLELKLAK